MIPEDQDPVWKLLAQLPAVKVRDDFEASVLSEVEKQRGKEKIIPFWRLSTRALSAIAATVAIAVSVWVLIQSKSNENAYDATANVVQTSAQPSGESVAELRQLYYMEDLLHDHDINAMADEEIALLLFATSQ